MFRRLAHSVMIVLFLASAVLAGQTQIPNYETTRRSYFYKKLYPHGGWTFYCGKKWSTSKGLNIEHVYPASWMGSHLKCGSRKKCQETNAAFNFMEADLHNLYPALAEINRARSNYLFALLPDVSRFVPWCDFKVDKSKKLAQPRPIARGNIARSIFYMHKEYGLPVDPGMRKQLLRWHKADPVNAHERRRNDAIERLQGTRNPFIDNPALADTLGW